MTMPAHTDDGSVLLDPKTIRTRSNNILDSVENGDSSCFRIAHDRLQAACDEVIAITRSNYPDLEVPYHSRWRHFEVNGIDLSESLLAHTHTEMRLAAEIELVVISVLLDAGAGKEWTYQHAATKQSFSRSEGLAIASLNMFATGLFSSSDDDPCRVDGKALVSITESELAAGFQVRTDNALIGLESRTTLLNTLGHEIIKRGGDNSRLADLFSPLTQASKELSADTLLRTVLDATGAIWPHRKSIGQVVVADAWQHRNAGGVGTGAGYVPFHKLSQWLSYSLIEPLQRRQLKVIQLDILTGLPEYRNGGLLIDTGVLIPQHSDFNSRRYAVDSEFIVEWRALTVALLDRLADTVRQALSKSEDELPLAAILQGGTWAAGRALAQQKRGGLPPIDVISDGTVF